MKAHILDEIRRTAAANRGKPLGRRAFESETGIRYGDWFGKYWTKWGQALAEAGFEPNRPNARTPDDYLLFRFAELAREIDRIPVYGDLRIKRRSDTSFPNDKVFARLGAKPQLIARVRAFCEAEPQFADVVAVLNRETPIDASMISPSPKVSIVGYVYLMRSGRHYKIGRTNSTGRREYELAIQLPERARLVHRIATDDPEGIEAYWHRRFSGKRGNGEWFALTAADVNAFRRRRFQ